MSPLVVGDLGSVVGELPDSQRPLRAALSVNVPPTWRGLLYNLVYQLCSGEVYLLPS